MILIADSGSSKTDWRLLQSNERIEQFSCKGLNPDFHSVDSIYEEVASCFSDDIVDTVQEIFFYGSGSSSESRKAIVREGLSKHFIKAKIHLEHDLLGAARAACGHERGIAAILGTGSNCCAFDGTNVIKEYRSGGYILGDEGGGVDMGKRVLKAYIEDDMPSQLKERFEKRYTDSVDELLENIYKKPLPNRFIAQYSRFVFHHKNDPFMASLIQSVFNDFFEVKVLRFHKEYDWPLNIVGSIGFYFQDEIRRIAHEKNIRIGRIIEKPIAALSLYHAL